MNIKDKRNKMIKEITKEGIKREGRKNAKGNRKKQEGS
jgi:hypothetical protein